MSTQDITDNTPDNAPGSALMPLGTPKPGEKQLYHVVFGNGPEFTHKFTDEMNELVRKNVEEMEKGVAGLKYSM